MDARSTVFEFLRSILARRDGGGLAVRLEADLFEDLDLDSLELAELSALLEETLGSDPYSAGLVPRTVGEVVGFYESSTI